jgi:hypothetical protein
MEETKVCPSCQSKKPVSRIVKVGFRKIRCVDCLANRRKAMGLVKRRLEQERTSKVT